MFSNQVEILSWMQDDCKNIEKFMNALDKIMRGKLVLIMDEAGQRGITAFWSYKRNKRVRRN
jgi:hypothetical protein